MKRHKITEKLHTYNDVHAMLAAMKNIALMELHKLSGQRQRQRQVMNTIETAITDFLDFYPLPLETNHTITIVVGSERGFCGDFNNDLLRGVENACARNHTVLAVGSSLAERLKKNEYISLLPGPNIVEEIPQTIEILADRISLEQPETPRTLIGITALFHDQNALIERCIAPLPQSDKPLPHRSSPPVLTLPITELAAGLMEQAILLSLQEVFTLSLTAENQRRVEHMESALHHLDEMTQALESELNKARQENIIQEIETILLNMTPTSELYAATEPEGQNKP